MTPWWGSPTPNHYHVKKMALKKLAKSCATRCTVDLNCLKLCNLLITKLVVCFKLMGENAWKWIVQDKILMPTKYLCIFIKHYFEHSKRTVTSTTAANATVKENDSKIWHCPEKLWRQNSNWAFSSVKQSQTAKCKKWIKMQCSQSSACELCSSKFAFNLHFFRYNTFIFLDWIGLKRFFFCSGPN